MPDPRPPSKTKVLPSPCFALTWHTSPDLAPKHICVCCGGGGSAKTGVSNFIEVVIASPEAGEQTIKIDTGDATGYALDAFSSVVSNSDDENKVVVVLLAVGFENSIRIYKFVVHDNYDSDGGGCLDESIKMVGSLDFGKDFGTNTVAFDSLGSKVAVGAENGTVCVCGINFDNTASESLFIHKDIELTGHHIKAVCKVTYHPTNPNIFLSSAKDGTCRVWDISKPPDDQCLDTLQCNIFDPQDLRSGQKIPNKILKPPPGQCLVKCCLFADLQGHFIFTIQRGLKHGKDNSFLSLWKIARIPIQEQNNDKQPNQPSKFKIGFQEQKRVKFSDFPISVASLSGDYKTLALGDAKGCIMLIDTESFKKIKVWNDIHDFSVQCVASRPLPIPLAGEDKTGIAFDVICASGDKKMHFLTKQRKSTLRPADQKGGSGDGTLLNILLVSTLIWIAMALKISYDVCGDDFFNLDCSINTVWWATKDRPGISSVPI